MEMDNFGYLNLLFHFGNMKISMNIFLFRCLKPGPLGQVRDIRLCRNESEKEYKGQNTEYRIFTMLIL